MGKKKNRQSQVTSKESDGKTKILTGLLMKSAFDGNVTDAKKWIQQGANVHEKFKFDSKLNLMYFVTMKSVFDGKKELSDGQIEIFKILIEKGVDINNANYVEMPGDTSTFSPLIHLAVVYGYANLVRLLLDHGVDVSYKIGHTLTLLHLVAREGRNNKDNFKIAEMLLNHRPLKSKIDIKEKEKGMTPLGFAITYRQTELAKLFIKHGASIFTKNHDDFSNLHIAANNGDVEMIKILLDMGMDINAVAGPKFGITPLNAAVNEMKMNAVKVLLERGADPNIRDKKFGISPLHRCLNEHEQATAQNENIAALMIFKVLIKYGAKIDNKSIQLQTPLHIAAMNGKTFAIAPLVKMGADLHFRNCMGFTPLIEAAHFGHFEAVKILVEAGSDINAVGTQEMGKIGSLHYACQKGYTKIAKYLIDKGADLEVKSHPDELTPLHTAVWSGHYEISKYLIEHGAEVEAKDAASRRPIYYAAGKNRKDLLDLLALQIASKRDLSDGLLHMQLDDKLNITRVM